MLVITKRAKWKILIFDRFERCFVQKIKKLIEYISSTGMIISLIFYFIGLTVENQALLARLDTNLVSTVKIVLFFPSPLNAFWYSAYHKRHFLHLPLSFLYNTVFLLIEVFFEMLALDLALAFGTTRLVRQKRLYHSKESN